MMKPNQPIQSAIPVVLLQLTAGALILVNVMTRQAFKMPTTLRVGSAQDLMKPCPFSHLRIAIDDEQVACDIFQAALKACPFVSANEATLFIVQPQAQFVGNIAKSELTMLNRMVLNANFPIVDVQFFLNDTLTEDDWKYFTNLPNTYKKSITTVISDNPPEEEAKIGKFRKWINRNL